MPYYREKVRGVQGKKCKNTGNDFPALGLGVVLYLPNIEQLRDQMSTMQANMETLRTRIGQIADLRDAQGLREGQRALTARLTEMEECTSVQILCEFILRLEAMVCGNHGGVIGEAIRACNVRLDHHRATMDDLYAGAWYHDLSEQESEEEMQQAVARSEGHDTNAEINQERRIAHLVDVESEATRHSAEHRDKTLDHCNHQDRTMRRL